MRRSSRLLGLLGQMPVPEGADRKGSDPASQHRLAEAYFKGDGVKKDTAKAAELYLQAADAGYPRA